MELPPEEPVVANIKVDTTPIIEYDFRYGPRLMSSTKISVNGGDPVSPVEHFDATSQRSINKTRRVYLHYTAWCPYCKKMKPLWERVKETLGTSGIEFYEVDEDVAKTPGITGYPTIQMLDENGNRRYYGGQIDYKQLLDWVAAAGGAY
jgi:thiol-disulfide isomerase/thioredoxin